MAEKVQELFLAGRREEAVEAIPDELIERHLADRAAGTHPRAARAVAGLAPVSTMVLMELRDEPSLKALAAEVGL